MAVEPSRTLLLLRRAKSAWPDKPDHERPLAKRGRRDAAAVGLWLRDTARVPDYVICSTATRARQTWELAEAGLGERPTVAFEPRVYGASAATLLDIIRDAPPAARTIVVIGHEPAVQDLALALSAAAPAASGIPGTASSTSALDRMRTKFPTAALAVLELSQPWRRLGYNQARLVSFVTPGEIGEIGQPGTHC